MTDHAMTFSGHKQMREYRAQVVSTADPRGWLRVQVRVPGWWDGVRDADLPWAEYRLTSARANGGDFEPAEVGDWVWVDFPGDDTRYPRITGWCHFAPEGVPNLPHEAFQGSDALAQKRLDKEPTGAAPAYHGSRVITKHGSTIELAPDGSLRITQRASGTGVEIAPGGEVIIHGEADALRSSAGDTREVVGGDMTVIISGSAKVEVGGDMDVEAGGNINMTAGGNMALKASRIDLN